ncbi:MAG TPA: GNAT family N-acetyltransferase [Shinella sp.]|jgi:GNAT superfamily N-acetyltransferase|uniref:GNAT family N-acetyltransferase n=1 Tax=Shinella sp. TaxID=1870904 RepID=UPI002E14899C|nr:GNAT family N-acetyltransferase [Shinella sp.]
MPETFDIHPMTADRWADLEELFGPQRGANSGCWCMWPRLSGADYKAMDRADRKDVFRAMVEAGPPPGLFAYSDGKAVGWCAVGPRLASPRFNGAKSSRPTDDAAEPDPARVYAITCFFIRTGFRRQGLMKRLAGAAVAFARENDALAVDACAIETEKPLMWGEGFVGVASVFEELGFSEVARRSPRRPLMRLGLSSAS